MDDHKKLRVRFSVGTQGFALDEEFHRLTRGTARMRIEPQSFDLLILLVRNQGHPVTHDALKKWFRARDDATAAEAGLKKGGGQKRGWAAVMYTAIRKVRAVFGRAGKRVIELVPKHGYRFTPDLMEVPPEEPKNTDLLTVHTVDPIRLEHATQEIATVAVRSWPPCQREAIRVAVTECLHSLRRIQNGQIHIPGREAGYFSRFFARIDEAKETEHIKAYIRLGAFEPEELESKSWFHTVYDRLTDAVHAGKVVIEYVFLIREGTLTEPARSFVSRYERFATKISVVSQWESRLKPEMLRPSIVLMQRQQVAFTHDRGEDSTLIDATEWVLPHKFEQLQAQFAHIELVSECVFDRKGEPVRPVRAM